MPAKRRADSTPKRTTKRSTTTTRKTKPATGAKKTKAKAPTKPASEGAKRTTKATKKTKAPGKRTTSKAKATGRTTKPKAARRSATKAARRVTRTATTKTGSRTKVTQKAQDDFPQITLQPMLTVPDIDEEIAFLEALGFQTTMRMPAPGGAGTMHAVLTLNNAMIHLDPLEIPGMPEPNNPEIRTRIAENRRGPLGAGISLYVQVADVDAVHRTLKRINARVVDPPTDQFWGDRSLMVVDPAGYWWSFAQHIRDVAPEDMTRAMEMMPPTM